MKVYIPFNMVVDTDFGVIRIVEKFYNLSEYPVNKIKSFLLKREIENPIYEYCELRGIECVEYSSLYNTILDESYEAVLKLSCFTDLLSFIMNTYKLGLSNEMEITVGCNSESEIDYLNSVISTDYTIRTELNMNLKLNKFDYIFTKCLDNFYVDYLINNKITAKRLYVADYEFNTIVDPKSKSVIIDPMLHMRLESEGFVVSTISLYNKK